MSIENIYNKIYTEKEHAYGEGGPDALVEAVLRYKSSGNALELGAGQGRNALFLAEHSFDVTARDISQVGLDNISERASGAGLHVTTELRDIREIGPDERYDVIASNFVLHHLPRPDALLLITRMQHATNDGGLNTIIAFTLDGDQHRNNPGTLNFYPQKDELKDLYAGWDILSYQEIETEMKRSNSDGTPWKNVTAKLLARKPAF